MPVTPADLPEELIHSIVDFLSGQYLSYFPGESENLPPETPLRLTKRQLGRISLTCRHWAAHTRHKIFFELTLRSHDDARTLLAFARPPVSPRFGIAQHVQGLNLSINLAEVPWAYIIYTASYLFPDLEDGGIQLSVRAPSSLGSTNTAAKARFSSIHHAVPKTLPASLSVSYGLLIEDVHFAHTADLVALLRSVHSPPADTVPRSFLGRLPAGYYKLHRVSFADIARSPPPARLWIDAHGVLDLYMDECPAPWAFLRPFVGTRDPAALSRLPLHAWIPYLRAEQLEHAERILEALVQHNCGCILHPDCSPAEGHAVFHLDLQPGSGYARGPPDGGFRITLRSGCLRTSLRAAELIATPAGAVREVRLVLGERMAGLTLLSAALDAPVIACGADMCACVVQFEDSVAPRTARALWHDVSDNMPLVCAAGKLQFCRRVIRTRPLVYVRYDPEECAMDDGGEERGKPALDGVNPRVAKPSSLVDGEALGMLSRAHFYF